MVETTNQKNNTIHKSKIIYPGVNLIKDEQYLLGKIMKNY